ncbi:MAG: transketolase, partial [Bacteroidetes bacterium HGW-Bacteroidetes-22]
LSTMVDEVTSEDTASKYRAWGWHVVEINGNDHQQIRKALNESMLENEKPTLIIGHTTMGKGLVNEAGQSMEGLCSTHGQPVSKAGASPAATYTSLGADPENPFMVFPDVQADYARIISLKQIAAADRDIENARWKKSNPEEAARLERWLNNQPDSIDFSKVVLKPNQATRAASAQILGILGQAVENMIVASADLSNSDKTDGFLKYKKPLKKGDFTGGFLNAGVSELTMAAIANGIALHGGITVACGTFFVFSDYMKPAVRMSALMRLPVIYIWSHDAFRVGEDGPTHQPIEQEAQIRLMEHLRNHHNERSMLVLRPADADETTVAWRLAFENRHRPTALILSRQNIAEWPESDGIKRADEALQAVRGAYVVSADDHPQVTLLASGSEVSTLMSASAILREQDKLKVRVVSAISEGLFRDQPREYQLLVIPSDVPVFGLTAGLPVTLAGLVGSTGCIFGLSHFGYSAPAEVLDQRFGFTPEAVAVQIKKFITESVSQ